MTDRHREAYKEEAADILVELENSLLELEAAPNDMDLIGRVFRALHTIKGSGSMFGFDDIASFTHEVETVFDLVRNGKIQVSGELVDLTLSARDHIRALLEAADSEAKPDSTEAEAIIAGLRRLLPSSAVKEESSKDVKKVGTEKGGAAKTYRIRFRPSQDIFISGTNPLMLLNELRGLGECRIVAHTENIPSIDEIDPELCHVYWDIFLTTDRDVNSIKDVFIFVEDSSEVKIDVIDVLDGPPEDAAGGYKKLGEILIEKGNVSPGEIEEVLGRQKKIGELLVDAGIVAPAQITSALAEQQHVRETREKKQTVETAASIRVPSERLDSLVNLVGELVTVQARLSQLASARTDSELIAVAEEVERLTVDLRDKTMNIRMLPIGSTFSKFNRLVRDLSKDLGKQIEMITDGAETELDKTVIEKLNDPLVHLIRNSIDHGIETPEERKAAGKPGQGTIYISASHSGPNVIIQIDDDGKGLDVGAIRAKAVERGMIAADAELSQKEIFSLILLPGFSTARSVTNVSGRGVGMDVVKKAIDSLRGSIEIASVKGEGTTITLKLPLTLAIIEGLLVRIAAENFVIPLSSIEECIELSDEDIRKTHGRHVANVRGQVVPYIRLREQFSIDGRRPSIEQIVIVKIEGQRIGFVVDNVIGEHQTVIKNLGGVYRNVGGISGATILGDGTVALILDMSMLYRMAAEEEAVSI